MWRILVLVCFACSLCYNYEEIGFATTSFKNYLRRRKADVSLFSTLKNYHNGASKTSETKYPWIAQVVHSTKFAYPHACTAVCIAEAIFITAARCLYPLKIAYTNTIYNKHRFATRAFVFPTNPTLQMYDDIGFIVVEKGSYKGTWSTVALTDVKRTDETFKWFQNMNRTGPWRVVGYADVMVAVPRADAILPLTELYIVVGRDLCANIFSIVSEKTKRYKVPCYYSCSLAQFNLSRTSCRYHGTAGGAVYHEKKKILLGLATWGPTCPDYELPVGMSVVNSADFFTDYECAKRIRSAKPGGKDSYQTLCK